MIYAVDTEGSEKVIGKIVRVAENVHAYVLAIYNNGFDTTAGFVETVEWPSSCIQVLYDADHCAELPVDWYKRRWIDDRGQLNSIKEIDFGNKTPFIMEDGYRSKEVTDDIFPY